MEQQNDKLACKGCGASLEYTAGMQALKCQYCSTITGIPRAEDELADVPDYVIPLTVEKKELEQSAYRYMASGHYTPDDLLETAVFTKIERFYVPAYWFEGDFEATWTASFGYDRTETYTAYETRHENGRSRQVPVTRSRTVTDWNTVNGSDSGSFSLLAYGGSRLTNDLMSLVENSSGQSNVADYDVSFVSGFEVEPFSVSENAAYSDRADPRVTEIIDASVKSHAQGDRQRDWHWKASTSKTMDTVIVPICHVNYEYEGKQYNFWTDGANSEAQVADELPKDQNRKKNVNLGFVPAATATFALLAAGVIANHDAFSAFSGSTLTAVAAAWAYGFWRRHSILNYSLNVRKSLLSERIASKSNMSALTESEGQALAESFQPPERPWVLNAKKDKRASAACTVAFVGVILTATFWKEGIPESQTIDVATANVPVAEPAAAPVPAAADAAANSPETQVAEAPPQDSTTPDATATSQSEQSAATTQAAATTATEPGSTAAQATATATAPAQSQPVAATTAASSAPEAQKGQLVLAVLQAAAKGDWTSVDSQVQKLRPTAALVRGNRKASRAANTEGLQALQQKEYAAAISAFDRAIRADTSDIEVRNNLGYAYLQAGDFNNAVNTLLDVLLLVPDRSSAWANMSDALAQSEKQAAAVASLRMAVRYSSNRQRTVDFLNKAVETHPSTKFRDVAGQVLKELDGIPQNSPVVSAVPVAVVR